MCYCVFFPKEVFHLNCHASLSYQCLYSLFFDVSSFVLLSSLRARIRNCHATIACNRPLCLLSRCTFLVHEWLVSFPASFTIVVKSGTTNLPCQIPVWSCKKANEEETRAYKMSMTLYGCKYVHRGLQ